MGPLLLKLVLGRDALRARMKEQHLVAALHHATEAVGPNPCI